MATVQNYLSLWFLEDNECILSSRHCLPSGIFCMKAAIVACSFGFSNSESHSKYELREQATETAVKQNISL